MLTTQEKIRFSGQIMVLIAALVIGVLWMKDFERRKETQIIKDETSINITITNHPSEGGFVTNWAATNVTHVYGPGKPDRWGMAGTQDRYIDWQYPPLRTNLCQYHLIPNHGILWMYFCNDGQIRWEFKPQKP